MQYGLHRPLFLVTPAIVAGGCLQYRLHRPLFFVLTWGEITYPVSCNTLSSFRCCRLSLSLSPSSCRRRHRRRLSVSLPLVCIHGLCFLLWSCLCASRLVFPLLCLRSTRPDYSHPLSLLFLCFSWSVFLYVLSRLLLSLTFSSIVAVRRRLCRRSRRFSFCASPSLLFPLSCLICYLFLFFFSLPRLFCLLYLCSCSSNLLCLVFSLLFLVSISFSLVIVRRSSLVYPRPSVHLYPSFCSMHSF